MQAVDKFEMLEDDYKKTLTDLRLLEAHLRELIDALNAKDEADKVLEKYKKRRL